MCNKKAADFIKENLQELCKEFVKASPPNDFVKSGGKIDQLYKLLPFSESGFIQVRALVCEYALKEVAKGKS